MSGLYAADGSYNVTVVSGSTYTGLYAADGSYNVVVSNSSVYAGLYNPCGAYNVLVVPTPPAGQENPIYAPNGSLYVSQTPFTNGGMKVTVVSGSLTPGGTRFMLLLALTSN